MVATVDGTPVALPADARARELLAWLAVNPGPHSRSRLAGLLRPDVPEESARKTLRDAVYELRRAFAPAEPVVATRESVELRAEVDLAAFAAAGAAGRLEEAAWVAGYAPALGDAASVSGSGGAASVGGSGGAASVGGSGGAASVGGSGGAASVGGSGGAASVGGSGGAASVGGSGGAASVGGSGGAASVGAPHAARASVELSRLSRDNPSLARGSGGEATLGGATLDGGATLGGGELLPGLDSDWALQARGEHAADVAAVLERLAAAAEGVDALAWTRARIEHEPLGEGAHRDLIRLLATAGDRPAALAVADQLAERLKRELRVPPSPETRALVEEVRRGRVGTAAPTTQLPLPAPLARTTRPEGREHPLASLQAAWEEAATGSLQIAVASGEPGIGKTTLLGEFARRVHSKGAAVLFGRSDEQGLLPYQPWVEALERHLGALPPVERERVLGDGALARLLPSLPQAGLSGDPAGDRHRAFEAVRTLLEEASAERPLLLVLDDLQWADPDSLQLLRHIARMAYEAHVLIAISLRQTELTEAVAATLADLRREGPLVQLALRGIDEDAVAAVLARHDAAGDAAAYRERTGGNPFFLDELLREEALGSGDRPPPGVCEVIGRRIARLPGPARCVLQAGAALGMEFEPLVLTTPERVLDGLAAAVAAGLLAPVDERRYMFPHALIRETVLAEMPPSRKAGMHLAIADVLEAQSGHAGEIAKHVRAAGECAPPERRIASELAAGRQAEAALAYEDAAAHYEAALAEVRHSRPGAALVDVRRGRGAAPDEERRGSPGAAPDEERRGSPGATPDEERRGSPGAAPDEKRRGSPGATPDEERRGSPGATPGEVGRKPTPGAADRAEILLALGAARDRAGRRPQAQAAFDEAIELARERHDPLLLARAALGRGGVGVLVAATDERVTRPLEQALAALPANERALAARLRARLSLEFYYADHDRAAALSAHAVSDARRSGDSSALASALNARRVVLWRPEHIEERLDVSTEMIEAAEAAGDRESVLQGRNWRVVDLMELGEREALDHEIAAYETLADAVGLAHFRWYVPLWRSALAQLEGRWADAEALSRDAITLAARSGDQMAPWLIQVQDEATAEARGTPELVDRARMVEQAKTSAEPWSWLSVAAYLDAVTGHEDRARAALRELVADGGAKLPTGLNWHVLAYVAETAALLRDREAAELLYATARAARPPVPRCRAWWRVHRLRPVLHRGPRPRPRTLRRGRAAPAPGDHREPANRCAPPRDHGAGAPRRAVDRTRRNRARARAVARGRRAG